MSFLGAWLVTEYVYNPDGTFAGTIRQRRELTQLADGRIRVSQHCRPDEALNEHPMARFVGKPEFELSSDGRLRHYHGPAVIGTGISWGEGAMTGRGLWPEFGHNFRSFAILLAGSCQLTGGKFFNATEMIANIVGIAVPEAETEAYPTLNQTFRPTSPVWQGTICTVLADGTALAKRPLRRTFQTVVQEQISWQEDGQTVRLSWDGGRYRSSDSIAKLYGPLLEIETVRENGRICEQMEFLDNQRGHLVSLRKWLCGEMLEKVEVVRLRPQ